MLFILQKTTMQITKMLNGIDTIHQDHDIATYYLALAKGGIVSWLTITNNDKNTLISKGKAIIECQRGTGETLAVVFYVTEEVSLEKKDWFVIVEINQENIDDHFLNNEEGTGIWSCKITDTLPAKNFLLLWKIENWNINTSEREEAKIKGEKIDSIDITQLKNNWQPIKVASEEFVKSKLEESWAVSYLSAKRELGEDFWELVSILPTFSNYTQNWFTVSADSEETSSEQAQVRKCLDKNNDTIWHSAYFFDSPMPHWLQIQCPWSTPVAGFSFTTRWNINYWNPKEFIFQWSNDWVTWTAIKSYNEELAEKGKKYVYDLGTVVNYSYYRLYITSALTNSSFVYLAGFELLTKQLTWPKAYFIGEGEERFSAWKKYLSNPEIPSRCKVDWIEFIGGAKWDTTLWIEWGIYELPERIKYTGDLYVQENWSLGNNVTALYVGKGLINKIKIEDTAVFIVPWDDVSISCTKIESHIGQGDKSEEKICEHIINSIYPIKWIKIYWKARQDVNYSKTYFNIYINDTRVARIDTRGDADYKEYSTEIFGIQKGDRIAFWNEKEPNYVRQSWVTDIRMSYKYTTNIAPGITLL